MIRTPTTHEQRKLQGGENQRIYTQMRRFFAPASFIPPPGANPLQNGGRRVAATTPATTNDTATLALHNGALTWTYSAKFTSPPNVTAIPVGTMPDGSTPGLFLQGQGSTVSVIVKSANASDARLVNLHAIGT